MRGIIFVLIVFVSIIGYGQESTRLRGRITIDSLQIDAIHIINKTQKTGVINDQSGVFEIRANPGDTIQFSSVQYALKQHIVTQEDFTAKDFNIELEFLVNQLDEVTVTRYTLTGKIEEDLAKIPTYTENLPFWNAAELKKMGVGTFNDAQSPVKNIALGDDMAATSINLLGIVYLLKDTFNGKRKYIETNFEITDFYKEKFVIEQLKIPETAYYDFIDFINEQPNTEVVLNTKDKLRILEFLIHQSEIFREKFKLLNNIKQ